MVRKLRAGGRRDRARQPRDPDALRPARIHRSAVRACRRRRRPRRRQIRARHLRRRRPSRGRRPLSCTHDANSWPADLYAGLPAPAPASGSSSGCRTATLADPAGRHRAQPRWATSGVAPLERADRALRHARGRCRRAAARGALAAADRGARRQTHGAAALRDRRSADRRRIAHVNVERNDLKPDPRLPELGKSLGKGYLLPAPILPRDAGDRWRCRRRWRPRRPSCRSRAIVYDAAGKEIARHRFGRLPRDHRDGARSRSWLGGEALGDGYGHIELVYDFADGGDGRRLAARDCSAIEHRASGHAAETSFGAHVFNTVLTYSDEPQSYAGGRRGSRRGCSCASARRATTRSAT